MTDRLDNVAEGLVSRACQPDQDMAADVMSHRTDAHLGPARTSLPPLVTSPPSKAKLERASSYANKRMSTFSNASTTASIPPPRSRPQAAAIPVFHTSLP